MVRDIDTDFFNRFDGAFVYVSGGLCSSGINFESFVEGSPQDAFGHVAAAGVSCAEDEDFFGIVHGGLSVRLSWL